MGGVFINYRRRGEHTGAVEALYHDLARHFGASEVFLDRPSIRPGDPHASVLTQRIRDCDVVLVVIHPSWLTATEDGTRLIDRPRDWVREEIEIALETGRHLIPVLLGDAQLPSPAALPASIRTLPQLQAHRLRDGCFAPDTGTLIAELDRHIAPAWTPPPAPRPQFPTPPRRLLPAAILAAALLLLPPALTLTYVYPYTRELLEPVFLFLYLSVFAMAFPFLSTLLPYFFRARFVPMEREIQSWSNARFTRFSMPVMLVFLLFGTAVGTAMSENWRLALPLGLGGCVVILFRILYRMHENERRQRREEAAWPQPLREPIHKDTFPPELRRTMSHLRDRVAQWPDPPSRDQRDRLSWILTHLQRTMHRLRAQAHRPRWRWLIDDHPRAASLYAVWMAATIGLILALLLPRTLDGTLTSERFLSLAKFLLAIVIACAGTLELKYRYRRWLQRLLATEIETTLADLTKRLPASQWHGQPVSAPGGSNSRSSTAFQ